MVMMVSNLSILLRQRVAKDLGVCCAVAWSCGGVPIVHVLQLEVRCLSIFWTTLFSFFATTPWLRSVETVAVSRRPSIAESEPTLSQNDNEISGALFTPYA